ncbi:MAG: methyltransferase domain-containing protein [Pyrinomonadaceae bacterium]|nr:methyltransferase domain-containing protein [Pyrinomonadaceae bacterium]
MFEAFSNRSEELERIDKGDYTPQEYEQFLMDIRRVNRFAGDTKALRSSLLKDIEINGLEAFSVLDVGAGSGELLRVCARFADATGRRSNLCGVELNRRSSEAILEKSASFVNISSVQGDGLDLPFTDNSFDYAICSLFTHHFRDEDILRIINEMDRVARRMIFVIDLHRHPFAYGLYKLFCVVFVRGSLVKSDGLLSIKRGFKPIEFEGLAGSAGLKSARVVRRFPYRLVLEANSSK